jgi:hypothetical protein
MDFLGFVQSNLLKKGIDKERGISLMSKLMKGSIKMMSRLMKGSIKKGIVKNGDLFDVKTHEGKHQDDVKTHEGKHRLEIKT